MQLIPSIDLRRGKVVRLLKGRDADVTVYSDDPVAVLRQFQDAGAERVHIVDLDAAFGEPRQSAVLARLVAAAKGEKLQLGGGLRSADLLRSALDSGFDRVVVGSLAVREPERFGACAAAHPGRLIPALEFADDRLRTAGWTETAQVRPEELLGKLLPFTGLFLEALVTDISRDGRMIGPNLGLAAGCARALGVGALVSGGVGGAADVAAAASTMGVSGLIVGRAHYEGRLDLRTAIESLRALRAGVPA